MNEHDKARWAGAYRSDTENQAIAAAAPAVAVHHAYARKLTELNDRQLRLGLTIPALMDPRDVLEHICALAGGMCDAREVPPMELVNALGAQVLALGLAVARVEELDPSTGGEAA